MTDKAGMLFAAKFLQGFARRIATVVMAVVLLLPASIQAQPNPYRTIDDWAKLPAGRAWGSTSAVYPAQDGEHIWVAERCGQNSCVGRDDVDPVLLFSPQGELVRSFGAGLIVWPHGIHVDSGGNVWIADARGDQGRGHQVHKFSAEGKLLMSLGKPGTAGSGTDVFDQPSDVLVAPNGDIFVADGHGAEGNNRIVKFNFQAGNTDTQVMPHIRSARNFAKHGRHILSITGQFSTICADNP